MEPYFSNNFAPDPPKIKTYKQQLFIDFRDYIEDIKSNDGKLDFNVLWSNGRHTARKQEAYIDQYGNEKFRSVVDPDASWNDSLSIPPYDYVTQVELLGICCDKVIDENYFIVDIPEFDGNIHSSDNKGSHDKFAIVYFDTAFKPLKGRDFTPKIKVFDPPLTSLNKIRIRLCKYKDILLDINNTEHFNINSDDSLETKLAKFSLLLEFTIKT